MSGNPNSDSATSPAATVNQTFKPPTSNYNPRPINGGHFSATISCDPECKWLLICAQPWHRPTSLLHLKLCSTTSDKQLFKDLRQPYLELRKVWWQKLSLKVVQSIRFVQVSTLRHAYEDVPARANLDPVRTPSKQLGRCPQSTRYAPRIAKR